MKPKGRRPLQGGELVALRSRGLKELPVIGTKEFLPTGSWLEGKQIQTRIDQRHELIKEERIEKISTLTVAEWLPDLKRARVLKKAGKILETYGYFKDNDDWLLPEEALYLLETNSLELFYGGVRLSIERGYMVLIHTSNGCSMNEYRTYSYLNKIGYKLTRTTIAATPAKNKTDDSTIGPDTEEKFTNGAEESDRNSEDDLFIIEDDEKEKLWKSELKVIPVNGENEGTRVPSTSGGASCPILLSDDDDDDEVQFLERVKTRQSTSDESEDSNKLVVISSDHKTTGDAYEVLARWATYSPRDSFLSVDSSRQVIDLCDDEQPIDHVPVFLRLVPSNPNSIKTRSDILESMPSAKNGLSFLKRPDPKLVPPNVKPRYTEYKVNLNFRPRTRIQPYRPHRPYQNRVPPGQNFYRWRFPTPPRPPQDSILRQAQEMQVMAMGMMRVASTLFSMQSVHWSDHHKYNGYQGMPPTHYPALPAPPTAPALLPPPRHHSYQPPYMDSRNHYRRQHPGRFYRHQRSYYNHYGNRQQNQRNSPPPDRRIETEEVLLIDSDDDLEPVRQNSTQDIKINDNDDEEIEELPPTEEPPPKRPKMESNPGVSAQVKEEDRNPQTSFKIKLITRPQPSDTAQPATPVIRVKTEKELEMKTEPEVQNQPVQNRNSPVDIKNEPCSPSEDCFSDDIILVDPSMDTQVEDLPVPPPQPADNAINNDTSPDPNVTSWAQLKKHRELENRPYMTSMSDVEPILKPKDCTNIESVLSSLQIFKPFDISPSECDDEDALCISYDLYLPNVPFKKSSKTPPNFRIIVVEKTEDYLPTPCQLERLHSLYEDSVPFLFAVVIEESISFFIYDNIKLPVL